MQFTKFVSNKKKIAKLQETISKQEVKLQELCDDVLSVSSQDDSAYTGNSYRTYDGAVTAIDEKYKGKSQWGNIATGNIIDVRSAFIIAQGLKLTTIDEASKAELEFAENFFEMNGLFQEFPMEYAKEAEIEGKFLCQLVYDPKEANVRMHYIPYTTMNYKVEFDTSNYLKFTSVKFTKASHSIDLKENDFVYRKFGGRIYDPNQPAMKIWKCLTQIDDMDKALRDLREINNLFATPIPHIECATAAEAKSANEVIQTLNFKLRKMFAHTGKLSYTTPDIAGVKMLIEEILTKSKIVSGSTGVPVHFMGFPDLLSNRATADNLLELIWASTTKEREVWQGMYNEALNKAIMKYNEESQLTKLKLDKVRVDIMGIPKDQMEWIKDIYLPALMAGKISLDLFLSKIPGIDIKAEKALQKIEEDRLLEKIKSETSDREKIENDDEKEE